VGNDFLTVRAEGLPSRQLAHDLHGRAPKLVLVSADDLTHRFDLEETAGPESSDEGFAGGVGDVEHAL